MTIPVLSPGLVGVMQTTDSAFREFTKNKGCRPGNGTPRRVPFPVREPLSTGATGQFGRQPCVEKDLLSPSGALSCLARAHARSKHALGSTSFLQEYSTFQLKSSEDRASPRTCLNLAMETVELKAALVKLTAKKKIRKYT